MKISDDHGSKAPSVDFTLQFELANRANSSTTVGKALSMLTDIAKDVDSGKISRTGAIIVLGDFIHQCDQVDGLVQMKPKINPIDSLIYLHDDAGHDVVRNFSNSPYDGAIVVDVSGQILGAGMYLTVDYPTIDLPEECGTRHKAAASFSLKKSIFAVLTLSEETNTVRVWVDGEVVEEVKVNAMPKRGRKL